MSDAPRAGGEIRPAPRPVGEIVIGAGVLLLAAVVWWQTASIPVSPIYARVGPTVVPALAAIGLGLLGVLLLVDALRGGWQPAEEKEVAPDRAALAWVAAGLVLNVLLIGSAGFTMASIVLFVCVARGFGSRRILRDAALAATFALVAYFGFAQALGINIGAGLVENALQGAFGIGQGG
jgi:putative tricarboxylic transport membrane protein